MRKAMILWVLLGVLAGGAAQAGPIQAGDFLKFSHGAGTTNGGEFMITAAGPSVFDAFVTFCLQTTQYLDYSHVFYVKSITSWAESEATGTGGDGTGRDYLDNRTAWIYEQYRADDWAALNLTGAGWTANSRADAVQRAIWCLEGEGNGYCTADAVTVKTAATSADPQSLRPVQGLNLLYAELVNGVYRPTAKEAQDQLVLLPSPQPDQPVPEPTSLLLLGTGLLGLSRVWKKRE